MQLNNSAFQPYRDPGDDKLFTRRMFRVDSFSEQWHKRVQVEQLGRLGHYVLEQSVQQLAAIPHGRILVGHEMAQGCEHLRKYGDDRCPGHFDDIVQGLDRRIPHLAVHIFQTVQYGVDQLLHVLLRVLAHSNADGSNGQ